MSEATTVLTNSPIFDKIKENLNGKYKRVEAEGRPWLASKELYDVLNNEELERLSKITGDKYLPWGTLIKNDESGEIEVNGGEFEGETIPFGLRWAKDIDNWFNKSKGANTKKKKVALSWRSEQIVKTRPQIVVTARPSEIFEMIFACNSQYLIKSGKSLKLNPNKICSILHKFEIIPLLVYLPVYGSRCKDNTKNNRVYNICPSDVSRYRNDDYRLMNLSEEKFKHLIEKDNATKATYITLGQELGQKLRKEYGI